MTPHMDKHKALIEKVARAICENSGGTWRKGEYPIASGENFEVEHHDLDKFNNHWRYAATAALNAVYEALKEPSEHALNTAYGLTDLSDISADPPCRDATISEIKLAWEVMLEIMLSASALSSPLGKGE